MELFIVGQDREERVDVEDRDGRFEVRLGERTYCVDAVRAGATLSLLIDGRQAELSVMADGGGRYRVSGPAGVIELVVRDPLAHLAATSRGGAGLQGSKQVTAYMPGRVVTVLVAEGDRVEPGQGILVIEAMKMENEIQTEVAGVVRSLHVGPGQAVESGDVLFEIE